jgi:hypothetical protein
VSPVMRMRKLSGRCCNVRLEPKRGRRELKSPGPKAFTHYRIQHPHFSSFQMRTKRSRSCVASCSCRRSAPVLTMTEKTCREHNRDSSRQQGSLIRGRGSRPRNQLTSQVARWPHGEEARMRAFLADQASEKTAAARDAGVRHIGR